MVEPLKPSVDVGQELKALRLSLELTQREVADHLGYKKPDSVSNWECGRNLPAMKTIEPLALLYQITPIALVEVMRGKLTAAQCIADRQTGNVVGNALVQDPARTGVVTTDRRTMMLGAAATVGTLAAEAAISTNPLCKAVAQTLRLSPDSNVASWEELAWSYLQAYVITPPKVLLPELLIETDGLNRAIRDCGDEGIRMRLCVPLAKITALVAMATSSSHGNEREARNWWVTSRQVADYSQDTSTRVWVRGLEAKRILYTLPHLPTLALKRAEEAIAIAGNEADNTISSALAARAQALSVLHQAGLAESSLDTLRSHFERYGNSMKGSSMFGATETNVRHAEAFAYTHLGQRKNAEGAQRATLALYHPSMVRQSANVELLRAASLIRDGEVSDGVAHAQRTLASLDVGYRTVVVQATAQMVLSSIPRSELQRSLVAEYKATLALPPSST